MTYNDGDETDPWRLTDIAMDGSGQLWGVDALSLYKVNKLTGVLTYIGSLGTPANGSNALTVGPDGTMYLASSKSTKLFTVNTGTGNATSIGDTGYYSAGDLSFYGGQLYLTAVSTHDAGGTATNDLVQVSLSSGTVSGVTDRGTTGQTALFGLAVYGGSLYALSGDSTNIYKFVNPASNGLVTYAGSYGGQGLGPAYGASEDTPEPATLVIWGVLGAIAIGAGWWRKR